MDLPADGVPRELWSDLPLDCHPPGTRGVG